jgi:hypothetical protein
MNEGSARTSTRWGASASKSIDAGQTVEVAQFGDMKLLAPQELALALYATVPGPAVAISVEWTLSFGNGSFNHSEVFTAAVTDDTNQVPIVLLRPAKTVQISARIIAAAAPTRVVKLVALVAPTSPTWMTDLTCGRDVSEDA